MAGEDSGGFRGQQFLLSGWPLVAVTLFAQAKMCGYTLTDSF